MDPVALDRRCAIATGTIAAGGASAIRAITGKRVASGAISRSGISADSICANGVARCVSTASRGPITAGTAASIGAATSRRSIAAHCAAAVAPGTTLSCDRRCYRTRRGVSARSSGRFGIGRAALAGTRFIFRGVAIVTGRDHAADRDGRQTRAAAISAGAAGSVTGIGRAARASVGAASDTEPASCLASLPTDIASANRGTARGSATDRRPARSDAPDRSAAVGIAAKRGAAMAVAASIRCTCRY
ncbi:MAG: hypothetical protein R2848_14380 [Thermomicrobiales bacterium]